VTRTVAPHPIVLYDGECGLCNRLVHFVLKKDRDGIFRFASLQSGLAERVLSRHQMSPSDLDTFYVVTDFDASGPQGVPHNEGLLARSDAVIFIVRELGGTWRVAGGLFGFLPRTVRDWVYRWVARRRYRFFGRYKACPLPSQANRGRFLDL